MKNGSINEQLRLHKQEIQFSEIKINQDSNQENRFSANPSFSQENNSASDSFISFVPSRTDLPFNHEEQIPKKKNRRL